MTTNNLKKYIVVSSIVLLLLISKRMSAANVIARHEGLRLSSYRDTAGIWTIGFGTIYHHDLKRPVRNGDRITRQKAIEYLEKDTASAAAAVNRLITVPLTNNQRIALTSLVYNIGSGAFSRSTLRRLINAGNSKEKVAPEFLKWVYSGGKLTPGLVNRRRDEMALFLS